MKKTEIDTYNYSNYNFEGSGDTIFWNNKIMMGYS